MTRNVIIFFLLTNSLVTLQLPRVALESGGGGGLLIFRKKFDYYHSYCCRHDQLWIRLAFMCRLYEILYN